MNGRTFLKTFNFKMVLYTVTVMVRETRRKESI